VNVFNNVILARNRQLPDDDRMLETCRSIFKSFYVNNVSVCIGWCADQVTLRSARCNDKDGYILNCLFFNVLFQLNSETTHFRMCLYDFLSLF